MKNKINQKQKFLAVMIALAIIVAIVLIIYIFVKPRIGALVNGEPINENFVFLLDGDAVEVNSFDTFSEQDKITEYLLNNYSKGKYSITKPYVVLNPYKISPLTALIMFKTENEEKITVTLKGKHNDDLVTIFEASKDHYIPIYGLYNDYENTIIIKTESGKSNTLKLKTDRIGKTGDVEVLSNSISNSNGGFYFGTAAIGTASIAYDNYGEIRWYLLEDYSKGITMLQNGNLLISNNGIGPDVNSTSGMIEVDMLGFIHREYELDGGYHHDALEMENGDLVVLTSENEVPTVEDAIVIIDRNTGKSKRTISMYKIVKDIDSNLFDDTDIAWGWLNGISYDKTNNELILSMRNRNSIVAIDYDSTNIKWIFGDRKYWSEKFSQYLISGIGNNFLYPAGQHSPNIDSEGNLSIFNNGYNANKEVTVSCSSLKNNASFAMVYKLDRTNKTAEVIYQFGGQEYFSYALSSYNYTYDNHMLFNSGWHFSDESIYDNPNCTQFNNDKYNSFIIEFDENKNKMVELKVNESKFEVVKANIYNLAASSVKPNRLSIIPNYIFDKSAKYSSNKKESVYEILSESEAINYKNSEVLPISFELINKQFALVGTVPDYLDFKVTFISTRGNAYRYTLKDVNGELLLNVDLSSLQAGRYYIYVNMGDKIYNTREYIELT